MFITIISCGCLIHWHWKASLISHLSVVIPSLPFTNADEFLRSPFQLTLVEGTALASALETASTGNLKSIWDTKVKDKKKSLKPDLSAAMDLLSREQYALFEGQPLVESQSEYSDCTIVDTGFVLMSFDLAFPVAKKSPYKELFNQAMLKSKENGAIFRIKQRYKIIPPTCGGSKGSSLGFETLGFAFGTFVAGPILAVLSLMIEAVYKRKLSYMMQSKEDNNNVFMNK